MAEGRINGRVQWFNRRRGYGFINVIDEGEHLNNEYFCHYTNVSTENYKTLYPGEYVSFKLDNNDKGQIVCIDIKGINEGPLLIDNEAHSFRIIPKHRLNVSDDNLNSNIDNNFTNV